MEWCLPAHSPTGNHSQLGSSMNQPIQHVLLVPRTSGGMWANQPWPKEKRTTQALTSAEGAKNSISEHMTSKGAIAVDCCYVATWWYHWILHHTSLLH